MPTTIGQIYVNEALPPEYRDYNRVMGAPEMKGILTDIINNHPDKYREVSAALMRAGNKFAYEGGTTLRLSDVAPPFDRKPLYASIEKAENAIRSSRLSDDEKNEQLKSLYEKAYEAIKGDTYDVALAANNPFALQVKSKARGDPNQLSAMLSTPGVYANSKGETIPMFIKHSYAEGLSPAEIWAGAYGARLGTVSTKFATRQAGELGKLLTSASIDQVVTEDDCGTINGMPASVDDNDNIGALLASPAGGYDAGTIITKSVLSDIRKSGATDILVRSPITCGAKNGVCSHCAGVRETGGLPPVGYNLGTNAAAALAERLAQGSLNVKHSGKKNKGAGQYQGFEMIKRMATVPKNYADRATVAELDGTVDKIVNAPQGGHFVVIGDQKHYVPSGYDILVKEGDSVEAGDQLSDGVISPADAVRLKGIGEGRRYFANRFTKAFRDSGYAVNRRNAEAVAKALINNVVVESEDAEAQMLPGDTVTYGRWSWGYKPRPNSTQLSPKAAIGQYLEQPALHYTIGTRITKKVADELTKFKVPAVLANKSAVGVRPEMQSVVQTTGNTDDWMARLGTTYLGKRLTEDVQRGAESNVHGTNPYPGIAKGTEFGQWGSPGHRDGPYYY
jgi:DNA-directed RNA polymerase subunit beta'